MMRSGRLNQIITVQKKVTQRSDLGQKKEEWQDEYTEWAAVEPFDRATSSTKDYKNDRFLDESDHLIIMRWHSSRSPSKKKQIIHNGQAHEIKGLINHLNHNREWRIFTKVIQ